MIFFARRMASGYLHRWRGRSAFQCMELKPMKQTTGVFAVLTAALFLGSMAGVGCGGEDDTTTGTTGGSGGSGGTTGGTAGKGGSGESTGGASGTGGSGGTAGKGGAAGSDAGGDAPPMTVPC